MVSKDSTQDATDPSITLNDTPVTNQQLDEAKAALATDERIVEVTGQPGKFRKVKRLFG